jgi:cytochrome c peroxidase
MKHKLLFTTVLGAAFLAALISCTKDEKESAFALKPNLPLSPFSYTLSMPPGFRVPDSNIIDFFFGFSFNQSNPQITDQGATLGRVLFYDPQLSLNNSVSCSSCHHQDKAFSDGKAFSTGFAGEVTPRSSMAILNVGFNQNLFWDSRSSSAFELSTKPIQNHIEMGMESMARLTNKLSKIDYYPALFQQAFGDATISEERIGNALSQFVCSIASGNSKFDRAQENNFADFTPQERLGFDLFMGSKTNCARCHAAPNFAAPDFVGGGYGIDPFSGGENLRGGANNGLELSYKDNGMGNGRFRIPSLRNIAVTGPYMHDGRFTTLNEVIEHYNSGIVNHSQLDKNLKGENGAPLRMNLNIVEKQALIAFLHTLTDDSMMSDVKWSNPFNR